MSELAQRPGLFFRLLRKWVSKRNRRELETFIGVLAEIPAKDMAEILLCTAMVRRAMEDQGLHPLKPFNLVMLERPMASSEMAAQSERFNKNGALIPSVACSVWGHTFRAVTDGNLQAGARLMWRELMRGQVDLDEAASRVSKRDGINIAVQGAALIPMGFE